MDEATLTIGQVARRAGLKTSAIRYYESVGLLPEAPRESGQRRYGDDTLRRLQVIDVAKRAGFSLDEARVLLSTGNGGPPAHAQLRELAARKLPEVDELIARAQAMRAWLVTRPRLRLRDARRLRALRHRPQRGRARIGCTAGSASRRLVPSASAHFSARTPDHGRARARATRRGRRRRRLPGLASSCARRARPWTCAARSRSPRGSTS